MTQETKYNELMKKVVQVGDKKYTKSAQFGNRKLQVVHRNKKAYNRKRPTWYIEL